MAKDVDVMDRTDMMDGSKAVPGMAWYLDLFRGGYTLLGLDVMFDGVLQAAGW